MKKFILPIAAILIMGAGCQTNSTNTMPQTSEEQLPPQKIVVSQISPAELSPEFEKNHLVTFPTISLQKPGWVALFNDIQGKPGQVLATQKLEAGVHQNVELSIPAVKKNTELHAILFDDTGKIGEFEGYKIDEQGNELDPMVISTESTASSFLVP